jgi:hypothetical protein
MLSLLAKVGAICGLAAVSCASVGAGAPSAPPMAVNWPGWWLACLFGAQALLLGAAARLLVGQDLAAMLRGEMDPAGEEVTRMAKEVAGIALGLGAFALFVGATRLLFPWAL